MTELTLEQPPQPEPKPMPIVQQGGKVVVKANRLSYEGSVGATYRIWLLNIFLTIITLGIYSFWGKTRMRRYVTGSFKLAQDHFEYTGTGKELFIGFLKVFPFFLLLSFAAQAVPPLVALMLYVPVLYLIPVAIYMSTRYRLNRLTWRGIRGRLTGSPFHYGGFWLWRMFLNIITLGVLIPASDIATYGYMMNRAGFGNIRAKFDGKSAGLVTINIVTLVVSVLAFGVVMGVLNLASSAFLAAMGERASVEAAIGMGVLSGLVGGLLGAVLVILARSFYIAALQREQMRGLTLGPVRFKFTGTGYDMFRLRLGNLLLMIFTLGLAAPVVIQRKMRFMEKHVVIGGDLDNAELMQAAREKGAVGEGLDDLLGLDAGFGIG